MEIFPLLVLFPYQFEDGQFQRLCWTIDGAPTHQRIIVRNTVNHVFQNRVIVLFSDTKWPPRSPDATSYDFFLWWYILSQFYSGPPQNLNKLKRQINAESDNLKENLYFVKNAARSMGTQVRICIQRNERHVNGAEL